MEDETQAELCSKLNRSLFGDEKLPFAPLFERLLDAKILVQKQLARKLEEPLNDYLKSIPYNTLHQRRELVESVGAVLDALELAIKSPNTGLPARLQVGLSPGRPGGTFCFLQTPADRNNKHYLCRREELPKLELTPRPRSTEKENWLSRFLKENRGTKSGWER